MEWFALLIPGLVCLVLWIFFRAHTTWWELLVPTSASLVFLLIFKFTVKTIITTDTEYQGNLIVKARYYEYWETYVHKTCTRTTGSGKRRRVSTYDCSYCDHNSAHWVGVDANGAEYAITEEYYQQLIKKWSAKPYFVELNRDINYHFGCGKDGDMYEIVWDGQVLSSETVTTDHSYTNPIQASHSSFKLPYISDESAAALGLHPYPDYYEFYKQRAVLGLEQLYSGDSLAYYETMFQYLNGYYGPRNKVKFFFCVFYNKQMEIAFKQEAFWDGGNQNEVVICMSVDKETRRLQWVKPFSFTNNKRFLVDIREDIMELGTFRPAAIYEAVKSNIHGDLHRSFKKDFSYLDADIPTWAMWTLYIMTILITLGAAAWCLGNEHGAESGMERKISPWEQRLREAQGQHRSFGSLMQEYRYDSFGTRLQKRVTNAWVLLKQQTNKK